MHLDPKLQYGDKKNRGGVIEYRHMATFEQHLTQALDLRRRSGRLRTLRQTKRLGGGRIMVGDRELLDFSSNDYLGLIHHPLVIDRAREWAATLGAGSGASRLVTGHSEAAARIEARIARAKGAPSALLFASGWQLNASVLAALLGPDLWPDAKPVVLADKLIHASLYAGCAQAGITPKRFRHNDLGHLAALLAAHADAPKIIVTESVFSMDGDRADLPALSRLAKEHGAVLYVDEAHATGVLGPDGMGLSVGLDIDVVMGTFSKALGGFGAYVAGSEMLTRYLVNAASGLVYATGLPPAVLGAMDAALELIPGMEAERRLLAKRADTLRREFQSKGLDTGPSSTQIIPVILGDETKTLEAARRLEDAGILAVAIRPPTVPPGTSRLRLTLSAAHTQDAIDTLADLLPKIVAQ